MAGGARRAGLFRLALMVTVPTVALLGAASTKTPRGCRRWKSVPALTTSTQMAGLPAELVVSRAEIADCDRAAATCCSPRISAAPVPTCALAVAELGVPIVNLSCQHGYWTGRLRCRALPGQNDAGARRSAARRSTRAGASCWAAVVGRVGGRRGAADASVPFRRPLSPAAANVHGATDAQPSPLSPRPPRSTPVAVVRRRGRAAPHDSGPRRARDPRGRGRGQDRGAGNSRLRPRCGFPRRRSRAPRHRRREARDRDRRISHRHISGCGSGPAPDPRRGEDRQHHESRRPGAAGQPERRAGGWRHGRLAIARARAPAGTSHMRPSTVTGGWRARAALVV